LIAIDGPAASGKSVVGAGVARRLGYRFVDTGAMYRAITWAAISRGIDVEDRHALEDLVAGATVDVDDAPPGSEESTSVAVDGEDATPHLRDAPVEAAVSLVSRVPAVRGALVMIQRDIAGRGPVVMAGRDIGSVVLPDADLKVYLDASPEVRAQRRADQIRESGGQPDMEALREEIARRDGIDSSRETSPLTAADGAVIIETDDMTIDEVVERILELAS
jgi:cytidylate kinase